LRKTLIAALGGIVALSLGVASATGQTAPGGATVEPTFSPSKAGTKKKPRPTKLTLKVVNEDDSQTASRMVISLPKNMKISTKGIGKCNPSKLANQGPSACPKSSRVGTGGTAHARVNVNDPNTAGKYSTFDVTAFVTGSNRIDFFLSLQGLELEVVAKGTLKSASGRYGKKLDVILPKEAQNYLGAYNGFKDLDVSLYKKIRKNSLFRLDGCPSNRQLPFKVDITYVSNPAPPKAALVSADGAANCTKP
jgi:hypothetical protein